MTVLNNIKFEPEVIDDIICLVEHVSPKRVNQRKYEENLIKMGYNIAIGEMTELKDLKAQLKVLEKKISFLEELEQTKSPAEEGYKKVYGYYPVTDVGDAYWEYFKTGYEQSQKDFGDT